MEVLPSKPDRPDELSAREVVAMRQLALPLGLLVLTPSSLCAVPQNPPTSPQELLASRLGILTYDYAAVPPAVLAAAENRAAAIFHSAGIELSWLDCTPGNASGRPVCPESQLALRVAINLVHRLEDYSPWVTRKALGFSIMAGKGENSTTSYVSPDRVKALCRETGSSAAIILGLAIAHEIGHLLLEQDGHTLSGLMRASWSTRELNEARLHFTPRQAKLLRAGLAQRLRGFRTRAANPNLR